ncbi:hypothetical protein TrLO_g10095 [Triparma laevis f. longispina]|uniref:Fe2OG dioxygenase domain-containing protein n=1 Tax=Triparma laevis f. longispina TaxID=1714387 RepID=A0A9W7FF11_9STRA|nr:hypothetical protein TrLO_g10095 [Triparma laevis f. longispina]
MTSTPAARPYTVGIVYPEDEPTSTVPHSVEILIDVPDWVNSMKELDMELDDIGSLITLTSAADPTKFTLPIRLPLRIDSDSMTAKFKKKKKSIMASGRALTVEQGQPMELMEAVTAAREEFLGIRKPQEIIVPPQEEPPVPPPVTSAQNPDAKDLYAKYKNTVCGHSTNQLQLVSPTALIEIVQTCLDLASHNPKGHKPTTNMASIMSSFYSEAQSELCRQLLVQAVKYVQQTNANDATSAVLSGPVKEKFIKLAEFQMRKIEVILEEKLERQQALVKQGEARERDVNFNGGKHSEKRSTHAHAPVFDKNDENSDPTLPSQFISDDLLLSGKTNNGTLSAVLLKSFKGSEKRRMKQLVVSRAELTAAKLKENDYAILDSFVSPAKVVELRSEIDNLQPHFTPSEIWVGKGADVGAQISVPDVRGDKVLWMCGGHAKVDSTLFDSAGVQPKARGAIEPCEMEVKVKVGSKIDKGGVRKINASVMGKFGALKSVLESIDKFVFEELSKKDERLSRITSRSDAMLAVYPGSGSRFQKHVDNTANDGRRLTVLLYLNLEGWTKENGGFLRVWGKDSSTNGPRDVMPLGGRIAMFYSDKVPHEVTAALESRYAMTVWYYDGLERSEAVASANHMESGDEKGDMEAQADASAFIKQTLVGDGGFDQSGESASAEELRRIGDLAGKLSEKAIKIVAGICGAPSEEYFLEAARQLTPDTLKELRVGLAKMGV